MSQPNNPPESTDEEGRGKLSHIKKEKFHALLIGINEYRHFGHLGGALRDLNDMKDFLLRAFGVSNESELDIRILTENTEPQATSAQIVREIERLQEDPKIGQNDVILIYYAGHGATLPPPKGWPGWSAEPPPSGEWPKDTEIQCVVALDAEVALEGPGKYCVRGVVPDRTLNVLLRKLADKKGRNITVIFDCCHSGSGTRTGIPAGANGEVLRGVDMTAPHESDAGKTVRVTIPGNYDQGIWEDFFKADPARGSVLSWKYRHAGLGSHVLLAACAQDETAADSFSFTQAFISALNKYPLDLFSCGDLIKKIEGLSNRQNPLCEGNNATGMLFDLKDVQLGRLTFDIETDSGAPRLGAGQILGIKEGIEFDVYTSKSIRLYEERLPTRLVTGKVEATSSAFQDVMAFPRESSTAAGATAPRYLSTAVASPAFPSNEKFIVHIPSDRIRGAVKKAVGMESKEDTYGRPQICVDGTRADADLRVIVTGDNDLVSFHHRQSDHLLGLETLAYSFAFDPASVLRVLRASAHFFKFFSHEPTPDRFRLRDYVDVRIHALEDYEDVIEDQITTVFESGGVLTPTATSEYVLKAIAHDADADTAPAYGIELVNRLKNDLFAWVFLFDCSSLAIVSYYEPRVAKGAAMASPTLSGATHDVPPVGVPLNFKSGPGKVLQFSLYPGRNFDVNYLRIFLSTRYRGDVLTSMAQNPPMRIEGDERRRGSIDVDGTIGRRALGREGGRRAGNVRDRWDVIDIPLVQRLAQ